MKILLMGNPNVGKSVLFSRLSGVRAMSSNYPGTTVEFLQGFMKTGEERHHIIDVPGVYSITAAPSRAEEIALKMLDDGDVIINVLDATHLERNLHLTLDLLERGKPMIIALNLWDEAHHVGIDIDARKLEEMLGVPVVPTVAITGEGIKELAARIPEAAMARPKQRSEDTKWVEIGHIVNAVQSLHRKRHTFLERLGDFSVKPATGLPLAILILAFSFYAVRLLGEAITGLLMEPLFEAFWRPVLEALSRSLGGQGFLHQILIGNLIDGEIDFVQSMGLLSTALFVELAMVLPYVLAYYLWLGLLEDFGYLPRLAVLLDRLMHHMGLHGWAIVPALLGLGCNIPGIMATRMLESRRERLIAATGISVAVPCASLQAMIWALVGDPGRGGGLRWVLLVYGTLLIVWILIGRVLTRVLPGSSPELLMEIPPYKTPHLPTVFSKLWARIVGFLKEALPIVMLGVLAVNIIYTTGLFESVARLTGPIMTRLLGLPETAVVALVIGFLRKDVAMGLLGAMGLSIKQLVVAATVLAMFFPCIATFVILARELGWRDLLKATAVMLVVAFVAGGLLNAIL